MSIDLSRAFPMKKQYFVYSSSFFISLGGNILSFSLIYRLTDTLNFNPGQIGMFMALGQIAYFLGCNIYHRFGSIFEPIKVFPVSTVIIFLASIPLCLVRVEGVVYVAYWIHQIAAGLFWPPVQAWLTNGLDNRTLNREMSFFTRSWMSGNMVGPLIAGAIYSRNSGVNFFLVILCYFLVLASIYFLRKYLQKHKNDEPPVLEKEFAPNNNAPMQASPEMISDASAAPAVAADRSYAPSSRSIGTKLDLYRYRGYISCFSCYVFLGVLVNIVPLYVRDGLGHTEWSAGLLLFIRCVASIIAFSLLARFTAWHFNRRWFMLLQAALMLCSFLMIFTGSGLSLFFIIVILFGLLNSACYNNSMFYSGVTGNNPKKNLALHEIFICLGNALGTAGGGFFYQHFGFIGTCIVLFLVLGLGMTTFVLLERRELKAHK